MRGRAFRMPAALLVVGWLLLVSLPAAPAEGPAHIDPRAGLEWGTPVEVASSSKAPSRATLLAAPDGSLALFYDADGLWQSWLDAAGRPLTAPRLLGRETPTFWTSPGAASSFAIDGAGNLWTVWDSSGTDIHLRKTSARGGTVLVDRVLRSNPDGAHGPTIAAGPDGLAVGYTSREPPAGGYAFVLAAVDGEGAVVSETVLESTGHGALLDGTVQVAPDGRCLVVLSTTTGGLHIELDPAGAVLHRTPIPLMPAGAMPVVAAGPLGSTVLAWKGGEAGRPGRIVACRISGGMADSIHVSSGEDAVQGPSISVQADGAALLCWVELRNGLPETFLAAVDTAAWEAYPPVSRVAVAASASSAPSTVQSSGRTWAAWPSGGSLRLSRVHTFGFEAREPAGPVVVRPHGTSSISIRLSNTGGLPDTLSLGLETAGLPAGWGASLTSGEAELPAGDGTAELLVRLSGPEDGSGPPTGFLRVLVTSLNNPRFSSELVIPLELKVRRGIEPSMGPPALQAAPGTSVHFELNLRNLGDSAERVRLTATSGGPLSVLPGAELATVPWSGSATVPVSAQVLPAATAGQTLDFTVIARSLETGAVVAASGSVLVSPGVELSVRTSEPAKPVPPGGTTDFEIEIQNGGTSPGPAGVVVEVIAGFAGWRASVDPSFLELGAGETAKATLSVSAPPTASGRFVVRVVAASLDGSSSDSTTVTALALPAPGLEASVLQRTVSGLPGGRMSALLTVTNTGNEPDDIGLGLELPSGWSGISQMDGAYSDQRTVLPGGTVQWTLVVSPPPDAQAGEYKVAAILTGRSGARAKADITAVVERTFGLALTAPSTTVRGAPGDLAVAVLHLRNLGNGADIVTLGTEAPPGWTASVVDPATGSTGPLEVRPGRIADLVLEVGVPFAAAESWSDIQVVAASPSGLRERLAFRAGLLLPDLSLGVSYAPRGFQAGNAVLATVTVTNTGEAPARNVVVGFAVDGAAARSERILLIPAGSSKTATFGWTPTPGDHLLRFEADTEHSVLERDEGNNIFLERVIIGGKEAPAAAPLAPLVVAVAGGSALLMVAGALGGGTEYGKYWLLSFLFVPLYTKIKKDDILDHFVRGQVYGYIKANPGEHYNSIKKALSLKNGTLVYHLKTLEREEFIKSVADGRFKRFYPREMKVPEPSEELVLRMNHIQHEILKIIRENPGISQKEIARRIGLSTPTVHYHINIMMSARVINVRRVGRETQCFVEEVEEGRAG
ncbi:MAG: winged helix-turn-helix transcriptional regulator [Euryarchaeota archaeon]|nr:winged helix-turn-helix transcriptional regulator [Euryarchaeota archaeon]